MIGTGKWAAGDKSETNFSLYCILYFLLWNHVNVLPIEN